MSQYRHDVTLDGEQNNVDDSDMDIRFATDKFGKTIRFQIIEGRNYTPFYSPDVVKQIKNVQMRPDDIYLSAFPRTGTHWTFEMTSMLLNGKAETIQRSKAKNQLEFVTNDKLNLIPSPRLLDTHMRVSEGPRELKEKKCKIIYNLRDPRDVAVSLYFAYCDLKLSECQCSFEGFFGLFLDDYGEADGIFGHWRDAEKFFEENPDIPVHFQIYEETFKNPVREVQNISDFLGLPRNDELCRAIAEKCHFSNMNPVREVQNISDFLGLPRNDELCRAIAEKCHFSNMVKDKDAYSIKVDGENSLYRKGVVGDWKNWFTDEMLEDYYRVYDEKMKGSRFYERYARKE